MLRTRPLICATQMLLCAAAVMAAEPRAISLQPTFERDVVPIFTKHCTQCHGREAKKSGLDLRSLASMLQGGESGEPIVTPGKPAESHLFELIDTGTMPPKGKPRLSPQEIQTIRAWIGAGAKGGSAAKEGSSAGLAAQHDVARQAQFVIEVKCLPCHGRKEPKAGLDLRTLASMVKGGKSGPALVPGNAAQSALVRRIAADEMPPRDLRYKMSIKPVSTAELETLRQWINLGVPEAPPAPVLGETAPLSEFDRQWWSFQPPHRAPLPEVRDRARLRTPLDAFLLAKLEKAGLDYSPDADRPTLIRRAYLDLIGIPPRADEIAAFVKDPRPGAYELLIDRLLASPHFGERWGQHWLDAAGYSDSEGSQGTDPVYPDFYRYRDYVIRSFNADKPYDRFLLEQLAGDELVAAESMPRMTAEVADLLIATGFLRTCIDPTVSPETNFPSDRYQVLADTVEIVSSSLLGLTMRCARCHSHKFDPLSQRDYYQFTAIFSAAYLPQEWIKPPDRYLALAGFEEKKEIEQHNAGVDVKVKPLRKELDELTRTFTERLREQKLTRLPEAVREKVRKAIQTPEAKRDREQKELAAKYEQQLHVDPKDLPAAFPDFKQKSAALEASIGDVEKNRRILPKAHGLTDVDSDGYPAYLLRRGEWDNRGPRVLPNAPAVLVSRDVPFVVEKPKQGAKTTGRRLALARWLTRPDHPLAGRVLVNRVWQHHFGMGIVATADDFGRTGTLPTHPELLDWLSREFVDGGWSMKRLHRLIMTSNVYRQQSRQRAEAAALDPENKLLWRMPLRRMDAEVVRDAVLSVTGQLNTTPFGPPIEVVVAGDGQVGTADAPSSNRLSIYLLHRRSAPLTLLETFDAPRMTTNCVQRRRSTVVSQALLLLNSEFMDVQAGKLADRIRQEAGEDWAVQVAKAYARIHGRSPTPRERELGTEFLRRQASGYGEKDNTRRALLDLCLVLLNSAEFLYVD